MRHHAPSLLVLLTTLCGCAATPPASPPGPPASSAPAGAEGAVGSIVRGAPDSLSGLSTSIPGSVDALYRFRFSQTMPGSDRFVFQDRELSFHFRPAPDALHFQVENRQNRPVWIDWSRSVFYPPTGGDDRVAHRDTRWTDRNRDPVDTQVPGLQTHSDYVLPLDLLVDPGARAEQLHLPLFYEDARALQYSGRDFGVDLVFRIEDRQVTYPFRFRVESVIPR